MYVHNLLQLFCNRIGLLYISVSHIFSDIHAGVTEREFKEVIHNVTVRRRARNEKQIDDTIEFLYTWWVNRDNSTARRKMLIDVSILTPAGRCHLC